MSLSAEQLEQLAKRLRSEVARDEYYRRAAIGVPGDVVHELGREELEAAWRGHILELDRAATFAVQRDAILPGGT
jgi:hypothetical protein